MSFRKIITFSLLMGFISFGFSSAVSAEEDKTSEEIAVSLVIDTSGSMAETDPANLRKLAADIFVDLLSPEDYLGIVSFSTDVTELVPMQQIGDSNNKQAIKNTLAPIINANGNTNYQLALQTAERQLDSFTEKDIRKIIIFLTDGVPEPDYAKREDEVFMSEYMNSLWQTTGQIGLKNYPVYALGFGTADQSTLQRIATDTRGEAKFLGNPSEIAVNFFDVLRTLKNRQTFLTETIDVVGENSLPFKLDSYTSQVTMVVTNDTPGIEVSANPTSGQNAADKVVVQKNENYTIVTMNQYDRELAGNWQLLVKGTGIVQLFGDKDLFLKSWVVEPKANMQHSINEPIDISVAVTGELDPQMVVEVQVSKNGTADPDSVILTLQDGYYVGAYESVDQTGEYILDTRIKDGETVVTNNLTTIKVQELPVLMSEVDLQDAIFKVSENQKITGYLELSGTPVDGSQGVTINSFNLVADYSDGRQEIYSLMDTQDEASGDEVGGDGIYTLLLPFNTEGDVTASLIVQGTYDGLNFTVENKMGQYKVVSAGEVTGTVVEKNLTSKPGGKLIVPIKLENHSSRSETVHLSMDSDLGLTEEKVITLEPKETVDETVTISVFKETPLSKQDFEIMLTAEDPLTNVESNIKSTISVISGTAMMIRNIESFILNNWYVLVLIILLPLLILAVGKMLYVQKVKRALRIPRYLQYKALDSEQQQEIVLPNIVGKIVIAFGKEDPTADLVLTESKYSYQLMVNVLERHTKRKWLEGYRTLSKSYLPVRIEISTTPPGIFKINGEVFTSKEIFDQDSFESGGYEFTYKAEKVLVPEDKAKNVLEGKL